jgi:hypothetical protein
MRGLCELWNLILKNKKWKFRQKKKWQTTMISLFERRKKIQKLVWASGFEEEEALRSARPCAEIRRERRGQKLSCLKGSWCAWTRDLFLSWQPKRPGQGTEWKIIKF